MRSSITCVADLAGARVLVAGARVTGVSAARVLRELGATVTVTDSSSAQLEALVQAGAAPRVVAALTAPPPGTDLVVTSPGFRPDAPLMVAAQRAGVPVIGDVTLAHWVDRARPQPADWLVVTGTNGKTTTVGMLESILRAAGLDAAACGNIGLPVLNAVRAGHRVLAVELSSFQLHWARELDLRAAVVLNVSVDHLDWHGSMAAYAAAKGSVYARAATAVSNLDDAWSTRLAAGRGGVGFTLGEPAEGQLGVRGRRLVDLAFGGAPGGAVLAETADVRPPGPHNVANALAAAALARAAGVPAPAVAQGLRAFTPAGHRGVLVGEHAGVRYIDDSKATNPHAARAALLAQRRVVWVAGGLLKGAEVDQVVAETRDRLVGAVLLGADRALIAGALARHAPDLPVRVVDSGDDGAMQQVVAAAAALASPGDVVLLAPAAASMDMFTDYAHRGRAFAGAVTRLGGPSRPGPGALGPSGEPEGSPVR
ncbi:MAG TPA: UDP-N-acetylmuramoyl-L-alanine--D-glutamate ligase [Pseudonocardiaceae bacterium]|jgi:UDP-N-acetylmuramoylalanine--D-glutamate ligase|nr:UDP-N-acetylmuramoyl-L-alanine--D-glutamate ligase [Pseudonocardiaceae bacterium]